MTGLGLGLSWQIAACAALLRRLALESGGALLLEGGGCLLLE